MLVLLVYFVTYKNQRHWEQRTSAAETVLTTDTFLEETHTLVCAVMG